MTLGSATPGVWSSKSHRGSTATVLGKNLCASENGEQQCA